MRITQILWVIKVKLQLRHLEHRLPAVLSVTLSEMLSERLKAGSHIQFHAIRSKS